MGEVDEDAGDGADDVQCALVEYTLGKVQTQKWTLQIGQPYEVGRKDSGADVEVDHPSLSRRQCSIAVTRDETGEMVVVILDPGSTNGTFVDKARLKKGVGLTKKLSEFRHISFGECKNGYKILVREAPAQPAAAAAAAATAGTAPREPPAGTNKRGGPLTAAQKAQIARLSRLAALDAQGAGPEEGEREAPGRRAKTESSGAGGSAAPAAGRAGGNAAPAAGGSRRERREAQRQNAETDGDRSRSRDARLPLAEGVGGQRSGRLDSLLKDRVAPAGLPPAFRG